VLYTWLANSKDSYAHSIRGGGYFEIKLRKCLKDLKRSLEKEDNR
jgi:hypothetical protein